MKNIIIGLIIGVIFLTACSSNNPFKHNGYDDPNKIVYSIVIKDVNGDEYTLYSAGTTYSYIKERKIN